MDGWCAYWLTAMLALAMVLGPTLGQMHRAVHAAGISPVVASAVSNSCAQAVGHVVHASVADRDSCAAPLAQSAQAEPGELPPDCTAGNWVHALFAGHGPAECQLLDQANHGYAGPPAVLHFEGVAPDSALPAPYLPRPRAIFVAASFDARAPPALQLPRA
ncbi:MAG: hypothetical protein LBJ15_23375 [Comamonas sp.]|uniref:hypothetical protein n=1 Tax=Comamonas sp. TaxID=34028 RepID=UPI0028226002|nr:hypothetical protein [Comamonas sp.]MDR0216929.1 hypothetical protein [Comamonas sp.]